MLPRSLLSLQRRPQRTRKMHMPYFWFVPVDNHRRRGSVVRIIIQSEGNKRDGRPLNPPPHSRVRIISHASSSSPSSSASSRLVTGRVIGGHKHRHKHPCASLAKSFIACAPMASLEQILKSQRPGSFYKGAYREYFSEYVPSWPR